MQLVPVSNLSAVAHLKLPELPRLREAVHLVSESGKVYSGIDAIGRAGMLFPKSRLLAGLMMLLPIRVIASLTYDLIAKHRHKISEHLHINNGL